MFFGSGSKAASEVSQEHLGNKGANLVLMSHLGLSVPSGFILDTKLGARIASGDELSLQDDLRESISQLEQVSDKKFGCSESPLLVSVRSGASVSMPGMMDTILNLGLTKQGIDGLANQTGDTKFAYDTYRRFLQSFCQSVLQLDDFEFDDILESTRQKYNCQTDSELPIDALQQVIDSFESLIAKSGCELSKDPFVQLEQAIHAVFHSWNSDRAKKSRELSGVSNDGGTAAIVQTMVFGNLSGESCSGVMNTRNPLTGIKQPFGEYIVRAQGEDIVSGFRTPSKLSEMPEHFPKAYKHLVKQSRLLEKHFGHSQEIEFTLESGKLWFLQTRNSREEPRAKLKIAIAMVKEGIITKSQALERCDESVLSSLTAHSKVRVNSKSVVFAKGLSASAGSIVGQVYFSSTDAVAAKSEGKQVILLRPETSPHDIHGIDASVGILTSRGGKTSHAAVVARGLGKPCITGAMTIKIDESNKSCTSVGHTISEGDTITLDATTGIAYLGKQSITTPKPSADLSRILAWREE